MQHSVPSDVLGVLCQLPNHISPLGRFLLTERDLWIIAPFALTGLKHRLPQRASKHNDVHLEAHEEAVTMERPSGPLGTATQSTGRPLDSNGLPRPPPLNTVRRIPNNAAVRHAASNSSLSSQIPISAAQVVVLAREAMKNALDENQTKAAEASGVSNELKPGVTIDLSHKQIQRFPEEVVDIIKNELERYFRFVPRPRCKGCS